MPSIKDFTKSNGLKSNKDNKLYFTILKTKRNEFLRIIQERVSNIKKANLKTGR